MELDTFSDSRADTHTNKCMKAPVRQSPNCIKKTNKIKYGEKLFSIWWMEFLHAAMWHVALGSWQWIHQVAVGLPGNATRGSGMTCHWIHQVAAPCNVALESWQWIRPMAAPCNVTCSFGIMTLNSPGGCTLQCGSMPLNSPKRPPYWNSTSGFDFGHIAAVDMSFCTSLRNFIQIEPPSTEKNNIMSICKMADLRHLGF